MAYNRGVRYEAVMFDLDGTLADTLGDITAAGNHALSQLQLPTIGPREFTAMIGRGARWAMQQAIGVEHAPLLDRALELYRAYYAEHGTERTRLYPGIEQLLDALTQRRCKLAVLSNKPEAGVRQVMDALFTRWRFDAVRGHRENQPLKPDPTSARWIADRLGVPIDRWVYVGDMEIDVQTARAAGMFAVGVAWGFATEQRLRGAGADAIIEDPMQLVDLT